ncbi:MAG: twin-arginine translocase TatA/TatE family subunit [Flavobacteriales bacterium]|nr:twin-arginine translocase TatA/TatE family subunit [Flavobacteriales bacterium]
MNPILLFGMPGGPEIFIILIIIVLLFGAKKIPDLMKGVGKGIREFKDATKGENADKGESEKTEQLKGDSSN